MTKRKEFEYELRRRWHNFWSEMRNNPGFRMRIIGFPAIAAIVAFDLAYHLFGWSKKGIISGVIFWLICSSLYKRSYETLSSFAMYKLGLTKFESYLTAPLVTMSICCIVKVLWAKGTYHPIWAWVIIWLGFISLLRLSRIIPRAVRRLSHYEYHAGLSRTFLKTFADSVSNPEEVALNELRNMVGESFEDIEKDSH